jgi:SAM-dependent methyltransferase
MLEHRPAAVRRLAGHARDVVYRLATVVDRVWRWNTDELMPPAHLRVHYYRSWKREVFSRACAGAVTEVRSRGLRPEHRLLDIGSGLGNLAIGLTGYLRGGYDGVDVHPEAVAWCQQEITRRQPDFRFHRADVISRAYNPHGRVAVAEYRFPFADRQFDFIFLGSVFTHLLPDAVDHYVSEISRLLAPDGVCVASYFLLNQESRSGVEAGRSFMSFPVEHPSGLCRLHNATIPEAAVAIDETFVRQIHARAGLQIRDIRRGGWWSGRQDDQDVLTVSFRHASSPANDRSGAASTNR